MACFYDNRRLLVDTFFPRNTLPADVPANHRFNT